jgi:hypothetical protein
MDASGSGLRRGSAGGEDRDTSRTPRSPFILQLRLGSREREGSRTTEARPRAAGLPESNTEAEPRGGELGKDDVVACVAPRR